MREVLHYYHAFIDDEVALISSGLVVVFAFQLLVFRWAERSAVVTVTYFVTSITLVGGPFFAGIISTPNQMLSVHDRVVVWTLLSFLATLLGIASSGSQQDRA